MTPTETQDRLDLQDLALAYAEAIDAKRADEVADLFTENAVFRAYDLPKGEARGRIEINALVMKLLRSLNTTMHHVSGPRAAFAGPDNASGVVSLVAWHSFYEDRPYGILWGRYLDDYERCDGVWRIARRTLTVHGQQNFNFPWIAPA